LLEVEPNEFPPQPLGRSGISRLTILGQYSGPSDFDCFTYDSGVDGVTNYRFTPQSPTNDIDFSVFNHDTGEFDIVDFAGPGGTESGNFANDVGDIVEVCTGSTNSEIDDYLAEVFSDGFEPPGSVTAWVTYHLDSNN